MLTVAEYNAVAFISERAVRLDLRQDFARLSREIGRPWMRERIVPILA